ncbi:hypothetical protein CVT24_011360 [Panaeolus cyanescens]|uniref:Protein kinase domain-containing protein n=1 Tax=Panaeolus cyanescens TaxID=181874 RepID=A0A409YGR1_9AGAR|nr:hypothetical protein CVT24_011360 [Panaeolus cyanescens]
MPLPAFFLTKEAKPLSQELLLELQEPGIDITEADFYEILARVTKDICVLSHQEALCENLHYDTTGTSKRWINIPEDPSCEIGLYDPVSELFNIILDECKLYDATRRKVCNTCKIDDNSSQEEVSSSQSSVKRFPPLRGLLRDGKYFRSVDEIDSVSSSATQCSAPIEVRLDEDDFPDSCLVQCAVYAQEIFINQPGRRFVFVPLITQHRLRVYRFDRGGVLVTPWFDYHDRPEVLIGTVILTCGQSGTGLGRNPAITWDGSTEYIAVEGTKYEVMHDIMYDTHISGRGTYIWRVEDESGRERVIKHMWRDLPSSRAHSQVAELELLKMVKGMDGVIQIIASSPEYSMFDDRGFEPDQPFQGNDRLASFIVMESYGGIITEFSSPLHLLQILRDAIAGHQSLWRKGIIHRDVSFNNILQGKTGAPVGKIGVLIDLDMSRYTAYSKELPECSWEYGIPAFQARRVMETANEMTKSVGSDYRPSAPHTYVEDLESFMWVFFCITTGYGAGGSVLSEPPVVLRQLMNSDSEVVCTTKAKIIREWPTSIDIHPSYPPQVSELLRQFMGLFAQNTLTDSHKNIPRVTRKALDSLSESHYALVLQYFDHAISELSGNTTNAEEDLGPSSEFLKSDVRTKSQPRSLPDELVGTPSEICDSASVAEGNGDVLTLSTISSSSTRHLEVRSDIDTFDVVASIAGPSAPVKRRREDDHCASDTDTALSGLKRRKKGESS